MKQMQRISYLDGLRGLAALMVVIVHVANYFTIDILPNTVISWLKLGRFGVQIFYILSAFTIYMSIERLKEKGKGYKSFYLRRFFRIVPLWYIAVLTYLIVKKIGGIECSVYSLIAHLLCVHGLFPHYISDIIEAGWSVGIECLFYLLVPFIIKIIKNSVDRCIKLIFIFTFFSWFLNIGCWKLISHFGYDLNPDFFYLWLPNQIVAFLIGIMLYLIIVKKETIDFNASSVYIIGIVFLLFLGISEVLFRSLLIAAVFIALSKCRFKLIDNPVLAYIGKVSYGCYLSHNLIITCFLKVLPIDSNLFIVLFVYLIGVPIVSIMIGSILYYIVETPFIKIERKLENKVR